MNTCIGATIRIGQDIQCLPYNLLEEGSFHSDWTTVCCYAPVCGIFYTLFGLPLEQNNMSICKYIQSLSSRPMQKDNQYIIVNANKPAQQLFRGRLQLCQPPSGESAKFRFSDKGGGAALVVKTTRIFNCTHPL